MSSNSTDKHILAITGTTAQLFCGTQAQTLKSPQIAIETTSDIRQSFDSRLVFRNACGWFRHGAVLDDLDANKMVGGLHRARNLTQIEADLDYPATGWTSLRACGMLAYVWDDDKYYKLESDLTTWTELKFDVTQLNDLNDVQINSVAKNQVLVYDTANSKWNNIAYSLANLPDTTVSSPAENHILKYDSSTSKWINAVNSLTNLSDTSIGSPSGDQYLKFNGGSSKWEAATLSLNLDDIADVDITSVEDGSMLYYDGTNKSKWVNTTTLSISSTGKLTVNCDDTLFCGTITLYRSDDPHYGLFIKDNVTSRYIDLSISDSDYMYFRAVSDSTTQPIINYEYVLSDSTSDSGSEPAHLMEYSISGGSKVVNRDLLRIDNGSAGSKVILTRLRGDGELNLNFYGDADFGGHTVGRKMLHFQLHDDGFSNPAMSADDNPLEKTIGIIKPIYDDVMYGSGHGGLNITSYSDSSISMILCGVSPSPPTYDGYPSNTEAVVTVVAATTSGGSLASLVAADNAFAVLNRDRGLLLVKGNGDLIIDGSQSSYDAEDDLQLVETAKLTLAGITEGVIDKYKERLNSLGIMHGNLINVRKMHALELGALGQMMNMVRGLAEKIGVSEDELFAMSKVY